MRAIQTSPQPPLAAFVRQRLLAAVAAAPPGAVRGTPTRITTSEATLLLVLSLRLELTSSEQTAPDARGSIAVAAASRARELLTQLVANTLQSAPQAAQRHVLREAATALLAEFDEWLAQQQSGREPGPESGRSTTPNMRTPEWLPLPAPRPTERRHEARASRPPRRQATDAADHGDDDPTPQAADDDSDALGCILDWLRSRSDVNDYSSLGTPANRSACTTPAIIEVSG